MIKLESFDLNLLFAFEAMLLERNVSRAAQRIALTQSALSNALSRLRQLTGDPLFVRTGGAMKPTRRAEELAEPVMDVLSRLRAALEAPPVFEPAAAANEFRIAASDYVESVLIPPLAARLAKTAPNVTLRCVRAASLFEPPVAQLQSGDLDLAIGFYGTFKASAGVLASTLFRERFVCIVRKGHPRVKTRLDQRTLLQLSHVRVLYQGEERTGLFDMLVRAKGSARRVGVTVSHILSVADVVAKTDLVGIVPERVVRSSRVATFPVPLHVPKVDVKMLWHERGRFDPAQAWLREQISAGIQ